MKLLAEAIEECITFTPTDVEFTETYVGLKAKILVTIQNDGETKARFKWRNYISTSASSFITDP